MSTEAVFAGRNVSRHVSACKQADAQGILPQAIAGLQPFYAREKETNDKKSDKFCRNDAIDRRVEQWSREQYNRCVIID